MSTNPSFQLETLDFHRFAPVALRSSNKKGYLQEIRKGFESVKVYCCLFGNLLYLFNLENDPNSLTNIYFLESCITKILNLERPILSITTVGGKMISFTGKDQTDLMEWMEMIESKKFIQINRKIDDIEFSLLQLQHVKEQEEQIHLDYQQTIQSLQNKIQEKNAEKEHCLQIIENLTQQLQEQQETTQRIDKERLLLLKSRSIIPKSLPSWALPEITRKGIQPKHNLQALKIWSGTWNLGQHDPFPNMDKNKAKRLLQPFLPSGYHMYILGVQQCPSDSLFECMDSLLQVEGYVKLSLGKEETTRIYGRNESNQSSLHQMVYTSLVIYIQKELIDDIKYIASHAIPFTSKQSYGAIGVVLTIFQRSFVILTCQFIPDTIQKRQELYQQIICSFGSIFGEDQFHVLDQFNYVLFLGDFASRLVDLSGQLLQVDIGLELLQDIRNNRTIFLKHDELNHYKKQDKYKNILYQFHESLPMSNFYPTYKKYINRLPVNYNSLDWVKDTYDITPIPFPNDNKKVSNVGSGQSIIPSYPDRIFYYAMLDLVDDFIPEVVEVPMDIESSTTNKTNEIRVQVHNYRTINSGEGFNQSDHSPVFATYVLRLIKDYSEFDIHQQHQQQLLPKNSTKNITSLLNELTKSNDENHNNLESKDEQLVQNLQELDVSTTNPALPPLPPSDSTPSQRSMSITSMSSPPPLRISMLPPNIYQIRLSNIRLIWGVQEDVPISVRLLFPAPYEAIAGERFVECQAEGNKAVSLFEPPTPNQRSSPKNNVKTSSRKSWGSSSPVKTPPPSATNTNLPPENTWYRPCQSKTGTSMVLEYQNTSRLVPPTPSGRGRSIEIPSITFTWRGDEPIDRLHISFKASMQAQSFTSPNYSTNSRGTSFTSSAIEDNSNDDDRKFGHCSLSLDQLCKIALSNNAMNNTISTSITRILINRGRPMFHLDNQSMQREMVTLCCRLELLQ